MTERTKLVQRVALLLLVLGACAGLALGASLGAAWEADLRERRLALAWVALAGIAVGALLLHQRRAVARRLIPLLAGAVTLAAVLALVVAVDAVRAHRLLAKPLGAGQEAGLDPGAEPGGSCMRPDALLGWVLRPGAVCRHALPGNFDASYRIDERGFREIPSPAEAERRIFFFGDSYTFGHGVSNPETFSHRIATQYLVPRVQVVNAGVSGYGLVQIYGRLLREQERIRPGDLVVLSPISHDLARNIDDLEALTTYAFQGFAYPRFVDGEIRPDRIGSRGERIQAVLLSGPLTRDFFRFLRRALVAPPNVAQGHEIVAAARRVVEQRGADFVLLFLPRVNEVRKGRYMVDVSSFDFPDLRGFFPQDAEALAALRFPSDGHWNARGHAVAAHAVVEVLGAGGFLEPAQLQPRPEAP